MSDDDYYYVSGQGGSWAQWTGMSSAFTRIMGLSVFASLYSNSYVFDSMRLFLLGSIIETGRRFCQWVMERTRFQFSITAQFDEGDSAYEWIVLFLTQEKVWRRSREFRVNAKSSKRQWTVKTGPDTQPDGNADYVPTYQLPQLFRWNGYWVEIKRNKGSPTLTSVGTYSVASTIYLTIYTLDMNVISNLVEEARNRYIEVSRPNVIIHTADSTHYGPGFSWNNVKRKARRPLSSIILEEGVIDSLVSDAQEFLDMEDWYIEAGIPYRRGYLLYGPPGTGKSSTIYALAGELGLEIYSLSLASGNVDDMFLQRAAASIPKKAIFLIEDIDCAFPSREEADLEDQAPMIPGYPGMVTPMMMQGRRRSAVTLSGLLNVIDGVGSEEGKLFFATTNYVDYLDSALIRPGRIDKKVQYKLATKEQARALFIRFFPEAHVTLESNGSASKSEKISTLQQLAETFSEGVPCHEFSTADLQGYLLSCKKQPEKAAAGIAEWVQHERREKEERKEREEARKQKAREAKEKREATHLQGSLARLGYPTMNVGGFVGGPVIPGAPTTDLMGLPPAVGTPVGALVGPEPSAVDEPVIATNGVNRVNGVNGTMDIPVTSLKVTANGNSNHESDTTSTVSTPH